MKFSITARNDLERALNLSKIIKEYLESQGQEVNLDTDIFPEGNMKIEEMDPDILVVVGGDGTILNTIHRMNCETKLFTVNMGTYGFLAEIDPSNIISGVRNVLNDDYQVQEHMRIRVDIEGFESEESLLAFNDLSVLGPDWKIIKFAYYIGGQRAEVGRGDGLVVATPTGSTGYSMSADGPYLDPRVDAFVINPLLPMSMSSVPIVIPSDLGMKIRILGHRKCFVSIDGTTNVELEPEKNIWLSKSDETVKFIRLTGIYPRVIERIRERG